MEKDDEVHGSTGTSYDFGARMLDPRIGRWLSLDRKSGEYADQRPYGFALNSTIQYMDPDGNVVVDPKTGEQVVKIDGQWKTVSGGAVSDQFVKNSQPVLDLLTSTDVGTGIFEQLQNIRTIVKIDLSDKANLKSLKKDGGNSKWYTADGDFPTGQDGLYNEVVITPDMPGITNRANADGIDVQEKLIQTMSVEAGHIGTKEQIATEKSHDYNLFSSPSVVEEAYGPLIQESVKAGKAYRTEKGQSIDSKSNLPIDRVNDTYGSKIPIPEN